ncbi:MAG TPA: periplasmic heavy metal sensor [Polyangiaceae bacterium]|nr:periplasmic heavy metal sensor [Polyangiaceae bacterium]
MHPGMMDWWSRRRGARMGAACHAGGGSGHCGGAAGFYASPHDGGAGPFGVRRPLRYLSYKLELDEKQAAKLAKILDELKTERAQAAVDDRRKTSALADAVEQDAFNEERAHQAVQAQLESSRKLHEALLKALREIHAMLDVEQRETLAYMIRSGTLQI